MSSVVPTGTRPPVPEPDLPAPSFEDIASQLAAGAAKRPGWGPFWKPFADALLEGVALVAGFFLKSAITFSAWVADQVVRAEDQAQPAFGRLAAVALKDLFGVEADPNILSGRARGDGRRNVSDRVGAALTQGLFGFTRDARPGPLAPGSAAAERYLGVMMNLALESWIEGGIVHMVSAGFAEKFTELDDILAQVLGLGRLSRRVMSPLTDILISTPLEWDLNKTYRPKLLAPAEAARQHIRGRMTREQFFEECARQGYSDERAALLLASSQRFLSASELGKIERRGWLTADQVRAHLREQGYTPETAELVRRTEREDWLLGLRQAAVNDAVRAFINRDINRGDLSRILSEAGVVGDEQGVTQAWATVRQELNRKTLTLAQIEQAVKRGLLDIRDYRAAARQQGYDEKSQEVLELLLLLEIQDEAAARATSKRDAARRAAEAEARAQPDITLSQANAAVRIGFWSFDQFRTWARGQRYAVDEIDLLHAILAVEINENNRREEEAKARREKVPERVLPFADAQEAFRRAILTEGQFIEYLRAQFYDDAEISVILQLIRGDLEDEAEALRDRDEIERLRAEERAAAERRQEERRRQLEAERRNREEEARARERARGGERAARAREVEARRRQVEERRREAEQQRKAERDRAAAEARSRREAETARRVSERREAERRAEARRSEQEDERRRQGLTRMAKDLTLAQMTEAVKRGVKSEADFVLYLDNNFYDADEIRTLLEILRAELVEDAARRDQREALAAARLAKASGVAP